MNSNYRRNQSDILRPFSIPQGTEETLKSSSEKSHSFARDNRVSQSYEDILDDVLREFDDDEVFAPNEPFSRNFDSPGIELIEESGPTFGSVLAKEKTSFSQKEKRLKQRLFPQHQKLKKTLNYVVLKILRTMRKNYLEYSLMLKITITPHH